MNAPVIKLMALMEAGSVTGPAKNLIEFARLARDPDRTPEGFPLIHTSIVTFVRSGKGGDFVTAAREAAIEVEVISERFRFDRRVVAGLREIIKRRGPDIIQSHNVKSHFVTRLSGGWRERPWIAFHHGYTTTDVKMRAYNKLDRWSLRAAAKVVTVSRAFAGELAGAGVRPERISVLHNSIDLDRARDVSEREVGALKLSLGIAEGERVVLAVGRLSREKGHVDLMAAVALLRRLNTEAAVRVVIVGDGPERSRIEQAASGLGVASQIIFAGQVRDARPYYRVADVLALPSHSEGSPNVLLEAMAAELPVVATEVGGVPEIVEHDRSALLVKPGEPGAMARALLLLLSDRELAARLTQSAYDKVKTRHSPDARLRALLEIYR
jgi:glycosyltransferase involved in cell wall biosynthesis